MIALQTTVKNTGLPIRGLVQQYRQDVKQFNTWAGSRSVDKFLIFDYFEAMKEDHKRPATIQRHKASIKKALLASMGDKITLNERAQVDSFFAEIKAGKKDNTLRADKCLDEKELHDLVKHAGIKTGLIIMALYDTAARVSELTNIKLDDCQKVKGGYLIHTIGKGSKEGTFFMREDIFDDLRRVYKGGVYLIEHEGKRMSRRTVYTLVRRAGRKIGRDISPHCIRHTWATLSLPSLGLPKVSAYLRHSDPATTAKYYLHGKPDISEILSVNTLKMAV